MTGVLLAAAFAGGLGLLILALSGLTDGVRLAGGSVLKANLAHWAQTRWRAFETGIAIALLVPSSAATTRSAAGFVNSGLVKLENAVWLSVGVSFGSVVTAWLIVACGLSENAFALGLGLVGLGALLRGGLRGRRAALGKALYGFGLLLVGVAVLSDAFHRGAPQGLPAVPFGLIGSAILFVVLGAALATVLRSASVAVAAAVVAVDAGAVQLGEAMPFVAGANLAPIAWAMWILVSGTAQARRVALCHAAFHGLGTVVGIALFAGTLPFHAPLGARFGAPFALASYHLLFQIGAALILWPFARRLVKLARLRFHRIEFEHGGSQHIDQSLLSVPDLAVDAFLTEVGELFEKARGLAHLALRDRVVSDQRLMQDAAQLSRRVGLLDHTAAQMISGGVPIELAPVMVELPRAGAALAKMLDELARFRTLAKTPEQGLDAAMRTRLRQLELAILHLVEGANALDPSFDADRCSQETQATLQHLADARRRMHDACGRGDLHATWADPLCARLDSLERVATHAAEVALGIDRALAPAAPDMPVEEEPDSAVVRWLRKVA